MKNEDTIVALATPAGIGAISIIRVSGYNAISIADGLFSAKNNKSINLMPSHTVSLGLIKEKKRTIDEVLLTVFKSPKSYTGEDVIEISCHASFYIQKEIIALFIRHGCRAAEPGEFTLRAFSNGKIDLSQAEAVADLISSENAASHKIALQQMRGGFSSEIKNLREELVKFASLIELELDFSEEDVLFADRKEFEILLLKISKAVNSLINSFSTGNVIKNGIPVSIVGAPNVGKSTLLNSLFNEDKAIVSNIPGTTRDTIEDELIIEGVKFRFIDTAGIRKTNDQVESIGIKKTMQKITESNVILLIIDASKISQIDQNDILKNIDDSIKISENTKYLIVLNKIDLISEKKSFEFLFEHKTVKISAKSGLGINELKSELLDVVRLSKLDNNDTIITNARHYNALLDVSKCIKMIQKGLGNNISGDLLAIDIREALDNLGRITGEITSDELLGNIFSSFCIGK
ncbi:MAG: tRNA uridine-5-carboxymethylaminomethyl(34) synthesis GTPase MnmE [Flavobacteriaceae bacterium]|nr:tRNA uridine-5-carboxymethylaminomethyl(34) synthesis GTPase MnmE [Flavobacteriaceae bacterium]|tara:strand:- start:28 stop:1416 length:1389 start_codon:yes stop_codon:yes gene_type:complete